MVFIGSLRPEQNFIDFINEIFNWVLFKILYITIEILFQYVKGSKDWCYVSIGLGDGLALNRQHSITQAIG